MCSLISGSSFRLEFCGSRKLTSRKNSLARKAEASDCQVFYISEDLLLLHLFSLEVYQCHHEQKLVVARRPKLKRKLILAPNLTQVAKMFIL